MKHTFALLLILGMTGISWAGPYAPAAGEPGSDAIAYNDPSI